MWSKMQYLAPIVLFTLTLALVACDGEDASELDSSEDPHIDGAEVEDTTGPDDDVEGEDEALDTEEVETADVALDEVDGPPPPCPLDLSGGGDLRVIVFGSRLRLGDAETYGTYRSAVLLQVHEVASCLEPGRPTLRSSRRMRRPSTRAAARSR